MALQVASTVAGAAASLQAGKAQEAAANHNASVAEDNAEMTENQTAYDVMMSKRKARAVLGKQRAQAGASGVTISGSPLDVIASSAEDLDLELQNIRVTGANKVNAYRTSAANSRAEGKSAMSAAKFGAATGLLTGLAGVGTTANKLGYNPFQSSSGTTGYYGSYGSTLANH